MFKKIVLLLFAGLTFLNTSAQTQVEALLRDANMFNQAFLDNDFETFAAMTIPSIIELGGGMEIMTKVSKEHFETLTASGMEFVSISPEKPEIIMDAGEELHAILPQKVVTKRKDGNYARTVYYLACSKDDGKNWTFTDLEPYDQESIKTFVPSFTGDLIIPEVEYAVKIEK